MDEETAAALDAPQDKSPGWVVQASAQDAGRQISLIPLGLDAVPAQKTLQFWTKGDNWVGAVSLGLVLPGQSLKSRWTSCHRCSPSRCLS